MKFPAKVPKEDQDLIRELADYRDNKLDDLTAKIKELRKERAELKQNLTTRKIAEKFGISEILVNRIINRGEA